MLLLIPLALIHAVKSVIMDGCYHPLADLLLGVNVITESLCCTDEKKLRLFLLVLNYVQIQQDLLPKYLI